MKLLLNENLPKRLKQDFNEHEIYTVRDKNWTGIKNGELLKLLVAEKFDAFLTFDQNLQYQQNFQKYKIPVVILIAADNSYLTLQALVPAIKKVMNTNIQPGPIEIRL